MSCSLSRSFGRNADFYLIRGFTAVGILLLQLPPYGHGADLIINPLRPRSAAHRLAVLRHFSGVPLLEKANMKAFGKLARYQQYIKATPVLFPSVLPKLSMRPDRW